MYESLLKFGHLSRHRNPKHCPCRQNLHRKRYTFATREELHLPKFHVWSHVEAHALCCSALMQQDQTRSKSLTWTFLAPPAACTRQHQHELARRNRRAERLAHCCRFIATIRTNRSSSLRRGVYPLPVPERRSRWRQAWCWMCSMLARAAAAWSKKGRVGCVGKPKQTGGQPPT